MWTTDVCVGGKNIRVRDSKAGTAVHIRDRHLWEGRGRARPDSIPKARTKCWAGWLDPPNLREAQNIPKHTTGGETYVGI